MSTDRAAHFIEDDADILTDKGFFSFFLLFSTLFTLDEWTWKQRGDPVTHIELRNWADIFLIAPLSLGGLLF